MDMDVSSGYVAALPHNKNCFFSFPIYSVVCSVLWDIKRYFKESHMHSEAMVSDLHASTHLSCMETVFDLVTTFPYANIPCLSNKSLVKVGRISFFTQ